MPIRVHLSQPIRCGSDSGRRFRLPVYSVEVPVPRRTIPPCPPDRPTRPPSVEPRCRGMGRSRRVVRHLRLGVCSRRPVTSPHEPGRDASARAAGGGPRPGRGQARRGGRPTTTGSSATSRRTWSGRAASGSGPRSRCARPTPPPTPAAPAADEAVTGAVAIELVHHGLAVPRRRDRRGRDPSGRPERERPVEQHRGDPRRRLPAGPGVVAGRLARAPTSPDCSPTPSASCAGARCSSSSTSSTSTAVRGGLLLGDRGQDRGAVRGRRAGSAGWSAASASRPRRADPLRAPRRHVLPDRRRRARHHRDRRRRWASRRART